MKYNNKYKYFLLSMLLFLIVLSPVRSVFAAVNINVTGISQKMRSVTLKCIFWKAVSELAKNN